MIPRPRRVQYRRSPRRKPLTLAAGFNCTDGIYICADNKFTTGISQFYGNKVFQACNEHVCFEIALSGAVDYGKMVVDSLEDNLSMCTSAFAMETILKKSVVKVFKEHIATVFRRGSEPQIEAMVAFSHCSTDKDFKPSLWKVVDASVSKVRGFDAVGSGSEIARFYVKWLYPSMFLDIHLPLHVA